ncbi:MAG: hypothetical protein LBU94_06155 [Clostridiales bacterium]|jgi:hypothetical protein|nr:hypothetical protein [Clostridiales bacterium]
MSYDIDKLKKQHEASTQGSWTVQELSSDRFSIQVNNTNVAMSPNSAINKSDFDFMVNVHNVFPELCEDYMRIKSENDELKAKLDRLEAFQKTRLILPMRNSNNNQMVFRLCKKWGMSAKVVGSLITENKLYETKDTHKACFVAYDENGEPKRALLLDTASTARNCVLEEVKNSDSSYAFSIKGDSSANKVLCFSSELDALSHASLYSKQEVSTNDCHRVSLNDPSFEDLTKFLDDNPQVTDVVACLNRNKRDFCIAIALCDMFGDKGYKTYIQLPNKEDWIKELMEFNEEHEAPIKSANVEMDLEPDIG